MAGSHKSIFLGNIKWQVIATEKNKMLLLSENCIDKRPIDGINEWLNNEFIKCFSKDELEIIIPTDVVWIGETTPTVSKVFLLSYSECEEYLVKKKISLVSFDENNNKESWWVRTKGMIVSASNSYEKGWDDKYGVRPAMWIDSSTDYDFHFESFASKPLYVNVSIPFKMVNDCDLNNSNVLFLEPYLIDNLKGLMKSKGISLKKKMSDEIDYVVTTGKVVRKYTDTKDSSEYDKLRLDIIDKYEKYGKPVILDVDDLFTLLKQESNKKFNDFSTNDKKELALELYNSCYKMVYDAMIDENYSNPIVTGCSTLRRNGDSSETYYEAAVEFLSSIEEDSSDYFDYYEKKTAEKLLENLLFRKNENVDLDIDGIIGIKIVIAVAVSAFVFCNSNIEAELEWARDKQEYRCEYESEYMLCLKLGSNYPDGYLDKNTYDWN